jgi:hypothetical protein
MLGVGGQLGEEKMDTSRYIARLMGPVMLVIGIGMAAGMFVEGESYSSLMKEFIGSRADLHHRRACAACGSHRRQCP